MEKKERKKKMASGSCGTCDCVFPQEKRKTASDFVGRHSCAICSGRGDAVQAGGAGVNEPSARPPHANLALRR